jgi:hypothetical protein
MDQTPGYVRRSFFMWVFANILGFAALAVLLFALPALMEVSGQIASALIISLPIGIMQWLAMRRFFHASILWILSIPLGILLYFLIYQAIPDGLWQMVDDESVTTLTALYLLVGFTIGLPQWLMLRRQFSASSLWLLGSTAGVGFSFWLILATDLINQSGVSAGILGVLVYPVITGFILTRLIASHDKSRRALAHAI